MNLFAIDPGDTTGIAYTVNEGIETDNLANLWELWAILQARNPDVIIIERTRRANTFANVERAIEMQAVAKLYAALKNKGVVLQDSQTRKPYLKSGFGMTRHEHDAQAHLMAYEARNDRS